MREITYSEFEAAAEEAEETFQMDEERFRILYQRTARPLWAYLSRASGNSALADDLLQETFYRFLTSPRPAMSEDHQRHYLFRIATNLLRDHWRRSQGTNLTLSEFDRRFEAHCNEGTAEQIHLRRDLTRALERLRPHERQMLWLAYVLGSSHQEIAEVLGYKAQSIRLLLFRARRKLADLLRGPAMESASGKCPPGTSKMVEP